MPAPKAVSPAPIAPPTNPASTHPTTSRLAFAPSTVPNSSELTTADITSFAVFTVFYAVCLATTWVVYVRKAGVAKVAGLADARI